MREGGGRRAVLGLGSNLGDRAFHLRSAVAALVEEVVATSAVWETEPVGGPDQGAFLNLVVVLRTERSPHDLLDAARRLETAASRVRTERWGPRTLDVDVLWVDGAAVDEPTLTVPHPRMFERDFVLAPLAEVAGDLVPAEWDGPGPDVVRLGPIDGPLPVPIEGAPGPAGLVARRRQVLEVALDLHPDLYLDQLVTALAAAGLGEVAEDDLVSDLAALGFEVDPDDDPGDAAPEAADDAAPGPDDAAPVPADAPAGPADPPPSAAASLLAALAPHRPAGGRTAEGPAVDRPAVDGPADDPDRPPADPVPVTDAFADDLRSPAAPAPGARTTFGIDRTVLIAAAVALLVVVVAFALAAIGGDDDEPTAGSDPAAADGNPADGTTDGTTDGPAETSATAPVGPGADPELADGGDASVAFDGADGEAIPDLGDREWTVVHGQVELIDGRAVATPDDDDPDGVLATVDAGDRDLRFEVALPEATDGTGVAFGVEDDGSYLLWATAPGFPTMALFQVRDGEREYILNGGVTELGPGVRLGIHIDGDEVELLAGGAVLATYTDDTDSTQVGLGLLPEGPFAVFDDVVFSEAD